MFVLEDVRGIGHRLTMKNVHKHLASWLCGPISPCARLVCSSYSQFYSKTGVHSTTPKSRAEVEQVRLRLENEIASRAVLPKKRPSQGEKDAFWQSLHVSKMADAGFAMLICKALVSSNTPTRDMGGWHLPLEQVMTWQNCNHVVPYLMIHYSMTPGK